MACPPQGIAAVQRSVFWLLHQSKRHTSGERLIGFVPQISRPMGEYTRAKTHNHHMMAAAR